MHQINKRYVEILLCYEYVRESRYTCTRACAKDANAQWSEGARTKTTKWPRRSPISILIELNATSYLMPETRQKLQLNGRDVSLYLFVHSSRLLGRSSAVAHRYTPWNSTRGDDQRAKFASRSYE